MKASREEHGRGVLTDAFGTRVVGVWNSGKRRPRSSLEAAGVTGPRGPRSGSGYGRPFFVAGGNLDVPLKKTTSWMVCRGHSLNSF